MENILPSEFNNWRFFLAQALTVFALFLALWRVGKRSFGRALFGAVAIDIAVFACFLLFLLVIAV